MPAGAVELSPGLASSGVEAEQRGAQCTGPAEFVAFALPVEGACRGMLDITDNGLAAIVGHVLHLAGRLTWEAMALQCVDLPVADIL
jgi:hypothetical protein